MALHHTIIRHATSSQSHFIVGLVLLSFVVWVTLRGHLARYLSDLGLCSGGGKAAQAKAATGQSIGAIAPGIGSFLPSIPSPGVFTPPIFGN